MAMEDASWEQLRQSNGFTVTRMRNVLFVLLAPTMLAIAAGVEPPSAGKPAVDKSGFNLFNPTPTQYLRGMDRDGPGATESPYTVDAGHFQIEFFGTVSTERDADWEGTFDPGLIYRVTKNLQFNVGVNIGVTRSADDWAAFAGMTWRY